MLNEILVLGQVPGTNFQITFSDLAFLFDLGLVYYLFSRRGYTAGWLRGRIYYFQLYLSVRRGQQLSLPV